MDTGAFSVYLNQRGQSGEAIATAISAAQDYEAFLARHGVRSTDAGRELSGAYAGKLISDGRDSEDTLLALARYARFAKDREAFLVFLGMLDGSEVMDNFHRLIGERAGEEAQRRVFEGLKLPTPGAGNRERAKRMGIVMERAQAALQPEVLDDILLGCLHDLPDELYLPLRSKLMAAGSFEVFIRQRCTEFLDEMEQLNREGELYYNQPITDSVLAFLREREDVSVGVYADGLLRITKIPFMTDEWLKETDPVRKRYLYCHCPWARESIQGDLEVPPVTASFCRCSAGFVRKPYDVLFGRRLKTDIVKTVLQGDDTCEFVIHIPNEIPEV